MKRAPAINTRRMAGFTMIELLIVITLIAVASALASLALRDPQATQLEQEGVRLAALLESARAEARSAGIEVRWEVLRTDTASAFRFTGLPASAQPPTRWLSSETSADVIGAPALVLGPEPIIPAQRVMLRLGGRSLLLATDGLGPFSVLAQEGPTP